MRPELAGVAEGLRANNPVIMIAIGDPEGAALYTYYANGELKSSGSSIHPRMRRLENSASV